VKKTVLFLAVAALFNTGMSIRAQSQRIAFVNSSTIFQNLPAAKDAQRRIDALTKPLQDSLAAMQQDLETRYNEYQKKEGLMTDAAKKVEQQKLVDLQQQIGQFRTDKFGADGEVAKKSEEIIGPIRETIKKAIEAVAKQERYNFVFDKTDQIQILLYGDPKDDITFKVIDRLNRGK
jgi:outer membrane protein